MKLLTEGLKKKLPKIGATDGLPPSQRKIICKFFSIRSDWRWYCLEGEREGDDWRLFCYVKGVDNEYGYVSLNELQDISFIERDLHFEGNLQEVLDGEIF